MDAVSFILDGLVEYLELERELGTRVIECDRRVLANVGRASPPCETVPVSNVGRASPPCETVPVSNVGRASPPCETVPVSNVGRASPPCQSVSESKGEDALATKSSTVDFVFLHDRPLSEAGIAMMAKILTALGKTPETAPIVIAKPVPKAKIYVVLGGLALRKFMPGKVGGPGTWVKTPAGRDALITYSPEYILRFKTVTPAVQKIKLEMWQSLKAVKQRSEQ